MFIQETLGQHMQTGAHYNSVTKYRVTVCTPQNHEKKNQRRHLKQQIKIKKKKRKWKRDSFGGGSWEERQRSSTLSGSWHEIEVYIVV